jgi:hypothetical protein
LFLDDSKKQINIDVHKSGAKVNQRCYLTKKS